jgi:esterase/lipase superfamily enzyme
VVAFTWPSAGKLFAAPPHTPPDAYLADQAQAGKSGFHLAFFLNVLDQLRADYKKANPNGRVFLLAHSMGNYALQAGVQFWFDNRGSADLMFDEVFLPGADEIDDSFERPNGGRLSNLPELTNRISLYYSRKDVAMYLSTTVNLSARLGFDGPDDKSDTGRYPTAKFRLLDCTEVADFDLFSPPDATHQYYRRSNIVRADIVAAMAGNPNPAGGLITL